MLDPVRRVMWLFSVLLALGACTAERQPAGPAPDAFPGLTQRERDFALSHLHATRKLFLDALAGLSEAQWSFRPGPDRWSVAQIAEHVTKTEGFYFSLLTDSVLSSQPQPPRNSGQEDEKILAAMRDRSRKAEAPGPLVPTGEWSGAEAVAAEFRTRRDRSIAFLRETDKPLRSYYGQKDTPLADTDAYQFFLMMAADIERHAAQIDEVKADPGYPKK